MIEILQPGFRTGAVHIPASKSQAHRLLICAALSQNETVIRCRGISRDIAATADCLNALGAEIWLRGEDLTVRPITQKPQGTRHLHCQESGSTLRFLLPLTGVLEADAVFHMEGRLPQRPLHPLDQVLTDHGMTIRQNHDLLYCGGRLRPGEFSLPGDVSSQYISGLLMALPLLNEGSALTVTGGLESAAYVTMTEDTLRRGGGGYPDLQRWTAPFEGIRPAPHHGSIADSSGRQCGGTAQRPFDPRHGPSAGRHCRFLRRPSDRHVRRRGSLSVRKPGHCAGHGLRFQVLPPFLGRF